MSLEEKNKATIRKGIEAVNERNLALLDELMASDFFDHTLQTRGLEGAKQFYALFFKGFPDFQMAIEDIVAEGDKVWVRITFKATHTGEWMGITPTGKKVKTEMVDIFRIVNGKLVEYWKVNSNLDFLKEISLIEYIKKGKKLFPEDA